MTFPDYMLATVPVSVTKQARVFFTGFEPVSPNVLLVSSIEPFEERATVMGEPLMPVIAVCTPWGEKADINPAWLAAGYGSLAEWLQATEREAERPHLICMGYCDECMRFTALVDRLCLRCCPIDCLHLIL